MLTIFLLLPATYLSGRSTENTTRGNGINSAGNAVECIGFENIPTGTIFGSPSGNLPGDLLTNEDGVAIRMRRYFNQTGSPLFGDGVITETPIAGMNGPYPFITQMGLEFDFSNKGVADKVVLTINESSPYVNFSVNGADIVFYVSLSSIPSNIAPNVTYSYNSLTKTITLSGEIFKFQFGGAAFGIDNVCYTLYDCFYLDTSVEVLPCLGDNFFVEFDMLYFSSSDFFTIYPTGLPPATYQYSELPIVVGPFLGDGQSFFEITAEDFTYSGCAIQTEPFGAVNCICPIQGIELTNIECIDEDTYNFNLNLKNNGSTALTFNLFFNGSLYGTYPFASLPLSIQNLTISTPNLEVRVCENKSGGCCNEVAVPLPSCSCVIDNVQAEVVSCGDGLFYAYLTYNWDMASQQGFQLAVNNEVYGNFPYTGSIYVGPLVADDTTNYEFQLTDLVNEQCFAQTTLGTVFCDENCQINTIITNPLTCDSTGGFGFLLDLESTNTSDTFQVFINNDLYGEFLYNDLPIVLETFKASVEVTVCDKGNLLCCKTETVDYTDCSCDIYGLDVMLNPCDSNGIFSVTLNFESANTSSSFVVQDQGGQLYGLYGYDELPVTFGSYEGDGITNYQFQVIDPIFQGCNASYQIGQVDCNEGCVIESAFVSAISCSGPEVFSAVLDLQTNANTSDSFTVNGINEFYGTFSYGELPVTLVNIPSGIELISITDLADSTCQFSTLVSFNGCSCGIDELELEALPCQSNDSFNILLSFNYFNVSDSFDLFIDSVFAGVYSYSELPVELGSFAGDGTSVYYFEIKDHLDPDCFIFGFSEPVDCMMDNCSIDQANILQVNCLSNNNYSVVFDLDYSSISDSFLLYYDSNLVITHAYSELPLETAPLNGNTELVICDQLIAGCCLTFTVSDSACFCNLSDLSVQIQDCEIPIGADFGNFDIVVDFNHSNPSDSFIAEVNGTILGAYAYADLPIFLGPFDGDNLTSYTLNIIDSNDPNCTVSQDFGPVNCLADCGFINLEVTEVICNADGSYDILLNFEAVNVQGPGVEVTLDGQLFQFYPYSTAPPIWIENYVADDDFIGIILCDNDNPGCCTGEEYFPLPVCEPCKISTPLVLVSDCQPDGTFNIDLDFDFLNTTDSFNLEINGSYYGTYSYMDVPIAAGPFEGDGVSSWHFFIEDYQKTGCAADTLIGPVNCLPPCSITNLIAYDLVCSPDGSNFSGFIDMNHENTSDSFTLFQGSTTIGTFAFSDLPLEVDGLLGQSGQTVLFSACDKENPSCCSNLFATSFPDCPVTGDCTIENFESFGFCDGNTAYLQLSFDASFTSDSFVIESCFEIETYSYDQGIYFLEITPEIEDCAIGNILPLIMYDQNDPANCQAFELALLPDCSVILDCEITNLTLEATDCVDGFFDVIMDFDYVNNADSFLVVGNGNVYGVYGYNELPVNIGSFAGDNTTTYEFGVIDLGDIGCNAYQTVGPINCINCQLSDLTFDFECEGLNTIINFDFNSSGTSDSFNVLSCSGALMGTFSYDDAPFEVTIPASFAGCFGGGTTIPFVIRDQVNGNDCFLFNFIELPDCANACSIYDVNANITNCEDGQFSVLLDFQTNMTGNLGFIVFVQGDLFGPFDYSTVPLELGPFNADGGQYDFLVVDLEDPFCYGYADLGSVECPDCSFSDMSVELNCNDNGSYSAIFDVTSSFLPTDSFSLAVNDSVLGSFNFDQLPLAVDSLTFTSAELSWIVCSESEPGCCDTLVISTPQCLINCLENQVMLQELFDALSYSEGDTVMQVMGVTAVLANPEYFAWSGALSHVELKADDLMHISAGAVLFDLGALQEKQRNVELTINPEGAYWIGLNNERVLDFAAHKDTSLQAGNAILSIQEGTTGLNIYLEGEIETFTIGAESMTINSFCYELVDDAVWPGDVNDDKIANYLDLLFYGLYNGYNGLPRSNVSTIWAPQTSADWGITFADGTDIKHADCDGDGQISYADVQAIKNNYNLTHGTPDPEFSTIGDSLDPPVYLDFSSTDGNLQSGQSIVLPLVLGTETKKISQIHGLALRMEYDPQAIASFSYEVVPGWFGMANEFTHIIHHDPAEGIIEIAITRLNQQNAAGFGQIAKFIGIIDDLAGLQIPNIDITNVAALDADENPVWIDIADTGEYPQDDKKNDDIPQGSGLQVYPNPTTGGNILIIKESEEVASGLRISNLRGEQIYSFEGDFERMLLDGSDWNPGIYLIQVPLESAVISKKLFVIRP